MPDRSPGKRGLSVGSQILGATGNPFLGILGGGGAAFAQWLHNRRNAEVTNPGLQYALAQLQPPRSGGGYLGNFMHSGPSFSEFPNGVGAEFTYNSAPGVFGGRPFRGEPYSSGAWLGREGISGDASKGIARQQMMQQAAMDRGLTLSPTAPAAGNPLNLPPVEYFYNPYGV